jgi:hypothetical protein
LTNSLIFGFTNEAFAALFNTTIDFFGPGTAPLTKIALCSASTETIVKF